MAEQRSYSVSPVELRSPLAPQGVGAAALRSTLWSEDFGQSHIALSNDAGS